MMFNNGIGFLDTGTYKKKATDLALQHSLVTEFTSLVAVDSQVSRENNQPLISHNIAQHMPDGWVDPQITKLLDFTGFSNEEGLQSLVAIETLHKVDIQTLPNSLKVNFSQTATNKYLYFFLSIILFAASLTLFHLRRRFY